MQDMRHIIDLVEAALGEARRNPHLNPKIGVFDALKKYWNVPGVYVTFTADVGKTSHFDADRGPARVKGSKHITGAKLGINPKSEYKTPTGIYAYPVAYVLATWENGNELPFAQEQPYIWVLQVKPGAGVLDLDRYQQEDFERDVKKVVEYVEANGGVGFNRLEAYKSALVKTPAGRLWNITREAARAVMRQRMFDEVYAKWEERYAEWEGRPRVTRWEKELDDDGEEVEYEVEDDEEFAEEEPTIYDVDEGDLNIRAPREWRKLLVHLGYHAVIDDDNEGIIHENEPTQAVFFSKDVVRPLELVRNIIPKGRPSDFAIWAKSPKSFVRLLQTGRIDTATVLDFLQQMPRALRAIPFDLLPEDAKDMVRHQIEFFVQANGPYIHYGDMGLSDEQMIRALEKYPSILEKLQHVSPAVKADIIAHPDYFMSAVSISPAFTEDEKAEFLAKAIDEHLEKGGSTFRVNAWLNTLADTNPRVVYRVADRVPQETRTAIMVRVVRAVEGSAGMVQWLAKEVAQNPLIWHSISNLMRMGDFTAAERDMLVQATDAPEWFLARSGSKRVSDFTTEGIGWRGRD